MTSAPVNGVGSFLDFVGNRATQTTNMGAAGSFGDVMSKASGNQSQTDAFGKSSTVSDAGRSKIDASSRPGKEISKADTGKHTVKAEDAAGKADEVIQKAGKELVKEVAEKLGVTEEEVVNAMEELGFGMEALLNADNLTQLVLAISGEDSLALLTNGELYGMVQDLMQSLEGMKAQLANELGISPEELAKLIEDSIAAKQSDAEQTEVNPLLQTKEEVGEETQAKITVTVESGDETVSLITDEKGNVKQVENVVQKETAEQGTGDNAKQKSGQENGAEGKGQMMESSNPILDNMLQNKVQTADVNFEQTQVYMTPDTNEIMNQILDYMKIQLKPGMDQLTMQLHPESLGTLHVQITSKGGEVTAQFQVQNEAVKAAIESQLVELKDSLKEQGIKVEAVEVTVESHAFESNLWQGQGRDENASYQNNRKTPRRINLNELSESLEELEGEEEKLAAEMMEVNGNTVDYTA